MIICTQCGDRTDDGADFCGSCGSFLEFSGQRVADEPTPEAPAATGPAPAAVAAPPPPPPHGLVDRLKAAVHHETPGAVDEAPVVAVSRTSTASTEPTEDPADSISLTGRATPPTTPIPVQATLPATPTTAPEATQHGGSVSPTSASAPAPSAASAPTAAPPAAPPAMTPTTEPLPPAVQPVAVRPEAQRARPAPRTSAPPPPVAHADDIVCGQCTERNARDRRFCRRCGASLIAAAQVAVVRHPWWRRLLIRLRLVRATPRPAPPAGEEPQPSRRKRAAGTWRRTLVRLGGRGGLLVVVGVVAFVLAVQPVRSAIAGRVGEWSRDVHRAIIPSFEPVNARTASATAESPLHPASLTIDGLKNTYWAAPIPGGRLPTLRITFPGRVSFDDIGFTPAAFDDPRQFLAQPRVRNVHVVLSNGRTADLELRSSRDFQPFEVEARNVTYVDLQILRVWPGQQGDLIALAEVEFFEKR